MGSDLFKQYTIDKNPFITNSKWSIHEATHKQRKTKSCVFVANKANITNDKETQISFLKTDATSLMKYKHPNILGIVEPFTEDKYSIGFITEYFDYSLEQWISIKQPPKLEIKMAIIEICKTLQFLHEDCNSLYLNISNQSIYFCEENSKIKLSGLNFITLSEEKIIKPLDKTNGIFNPDLSFASPEMINDDKSLVHFQSDYFSIGMLLLYLLTGIKFEIPQNLSQNYNKVISKDKLNETISNNSKLTQQEVSLILWLTDFNIKNRPKNVSEILHHEWFADNNLKALMFIENLTTNDQEQNALFLQNLPLILGNYESNIIKFKILPCLLQNLHNTNLINHLFPAIFAVASYDKVSFDFNTAIWPYLTRVFSMKAIPALTLYFILTKLDFIVQRISTNDFNNYCIDLICKALDCGVAKIQITVIETIIKIHTKLSTPILHSKIYPRIIQVMTTTNIIELAIKIMFSLKKLLPKLEQNINKEETIENISQTLIKNNYDFKVCSCALELIKENVFDKCDVDILVKSLLPLLCNIVYKGKVNKELFNKGKELIDKCIDKIKSSKSKEIKADYIEDREVLDLWRKVLDGSLVSKEKKNKKLEKEREEKMRKEGNDFLKKFFSSKTSPNKELGKGIDNNNNTNNGNNVFDNLLNTTETQTKNEESKEIEKSKDQKINQIKGWNEDENEKDDVENSKNEHKEKEKNLPKEEQQPPTTENKTNTNIANLDSLLDD